MARTGLFYGSTTGNALKVAELIQGTMSAGAKTVQFDASNLPSGVYWYKLSAGDFSAARKMVLMK